MGNGEKRSGTAWHWSLCHVGSAAWSSSWELDVSPTLSPLFSRFWSASAQENFFGCQLFYFTSFFPISVCLPCCVRWAADSTQRFSEHSHQLLQETDVTQQEDLLKLMGDILSMLFVPPEPVNPPFLTSFSFFILLLPALVIHVSM